MPLSYTRTAGLLAALLLGACQSGPVDPETTTYYSIPTGSTITLHAPVSIPAGTATIYTQAGEVRVYRDINRSHAHCSLEVKTLVQDSAQVIQPDVFTIHRSYLHEYSHAPAAPFMPVRRTARDDDGGGMLLQMQRVMYLRSTRQPDVFRLICQQWAFTPDYEHVTVAEVRQALGKLMTLKLANETI